MIALRLLCNYTVNVHVKGYYCTTTTLYDYNTTALPLNCDYINGYVYVTIMARSLYKDLVLKRKTTI